MSRFSQLWAEGAGTIQENDASDKLKEMRFSILGNSSNNLQKQKRGTRYSYLGWEEDINAMNQVSTSNKSLRQSLTVSFHVKENERQEVNTRVKSLLLQESSFKVDYPSWENDFQELVRKSMTEDTYTSTVADESEGITSSIISSSNDRINTLEELNAYLAAMEQKQNLYGKNNRPFDDNVRSNPNNNNGKSKSADVNNNKMLLEEGEFDSLLYKKLQYLIRAKYFEYPNWEEDAELAQTRFMDITGMRATARCITTSSSSSSSSLFSNPSVVPPRPTTRFSTVREVELCRHMETMMTRQRLFSGDRSHPDIVELDKLSWECNNKYPGFQSDADEVEEAHCKRPDAVSAYLQAMREKQDRHSRRMSRRRRQVGFVDVKVLQDFLDRHHVILTYPRWEVDVRWLHKISMRAPVHFDRYFEIIKVKQRDYMRIQVNPMVEHLMRRQWETGYEQGMNAVLNKVVEENVELHPLGAESLRASLVSSFTEMSCDERSI